MNTIRWFALILLSGLLPLFLYSCGGGGGGGIIPQPTTLLTPTEVTTAILKGQVPTALPQSNRIVRLPQSIVNVIDPVTLLLIATTTADNNGNYTVPVPTGGPYLVKAEIQSGDKTVTLYDMTPPMTQGKTEDIGLADDNSTAVALVFKKMVSQGLDPKTIDVVSFETTVKALPTYPTLVTAVDQSIQSGIDPAQNLDVQSQVDRIVKDLPTPTPIPTATNTLTPTLGPSPTPTKTPTSGPSPTTTKTPTSGPSPTPSKTPAGSPSPSGSKSPTVSPTATPTKTPTSGPTATPTKTPTSGPTATPTKTPLSKEVGPGYTYLTIASAITAVPSTTPYIINVHSNIYYEHDIAVNKPVTIRGAAGESKPILVGNDTDSVVYNGFSITSSNVTIDGFRIYKTDTPILVSRSGDMQNIIITNNEINNTDGSPSAGALGAIVYLSPLYSWSGNGAIVSGNSIINYPGEDGIVFRGLMDKLTITNNTLSNCNDGIQVLGRDGSGNSTSINIDTSVITGNNITATHYGIYFLNASGTVNLLLNTITGASKSIEFENCSIPTPVP